MLSECPQCGQKLRAKWRRCPRCRLLLAETSAPASTASGTESPASRWRSRWMWGAVGLAGLLAIFVAANRSAPPASLVGADAGSALSPVVAETNSTANDAPKRGSPALPFDALDLRQEAVVAYAKGDYATALARLEAAVASAPHDPEARNNLGQLLVRQGRAPESLPHFDEAVRLDGQRWAYRFNRARAYGLLNRWPDAITEYRAAASLFPSDHATLYNLGLALLRVRDYPAAVVALEQAVDAAPEEHDFLITLGTAYMGAEQSDRARATFERFLEVAPTAADAPRVRALLDALSAANPVEES